MAPPDCQVVHLVEEHEMTTMNGGEYALRAIKKAPPERILSWASLPCTGGSTWQYVNMANYRRRNDTEAIRRLRELWRIHRKLWRSMTILARL
eukprot:4176103-Prorocentrum_lima.AAC.1